MSILISNKVHCLSSDVIHIQRDSLPLVGIEEWPWIKPTFPSCSWNIIAKSYVTLLGCDPKDVRYSLIKQLQVTRIFFLENYYHELTCNLIFPFNGIKENDTGCWATRHSSHTNTEWYEHLRGILFYQMEIGKLTTPKIASWNQDVPSDEGHTLHSSSSHYYSNLPFLLFL